MDKVRQPSLCAYMDNLKQNPQKVYQIIEKIGEGSYATVYKALNKITDRLVAIKVFPANSDQFAYLNEIDFLRKIDHPYMVKLHDVYTTSDEIWMILDYCQLGSIQDLMSTTGKNLTEPEIACVCYSVLHALEYIHAQNKIHRDLKSANILINALGQVKLTDFGICSKEASANSFIGSLLWMAPEMVSCNTYDSSVDIWALGICIIEMAEGNAPFHHLHMVRAKYAIQKKPQTLFTDPSKYSEEIKDFLKKCLQVKPENRPNASELLMHEFIEKHKPNLAEIRKVLCCERIKKLEEFRKNKLIQKGQGEGPKILQEIVREEDIRIDKNENLNIVHGNHVNISQDGHTVIEKSSRELSDDKPHFYAPQNELTLGGNSDSQLHYAINHLKSDETGNVPNNNSPSKRVYEDQLMPEVIIFSSPLKPRSNVSSHNTTQEIIQQEDIKDPTIESESFNQSRLITLHDQSSIDTGLKRKLDEALETSLSIAGEVSEKGGINMIPRTKMYKATNESNFRVKHSGTSRVITKNVELSESIEGESILNPVSLDREKVAEMEKLQGNGTSDFIKEIMFDFNGMKKKEELSSTKLRDPSTATRSKGDSNGGSSFNKTPGHTPNTSEKHNNVINQASEWKSDKKTETGGLEEEKIRLQNEMKREMEEIQRKYLEKLNNLEKIGKV